MEPSEIVNPYALRISVKSWHYSYMNLMQMSPWRSKSLCGYFWRLMFTLALPVAAAAIVVLLCAVLYFLATSIGDWGPIAAQVVGILAVMIGIFAGTIFTCEKCKQWRIARLNRIPVAPPSLTTWELFRAWLKAKKDKVCPPIVFTDQE